MTRRRSCLLVAGIFAVACFAAAQPRPGGRIQITVTPDHADWKYALGEKASFNIHVVRDNGPATGMKLSWTLGPDNMDPYLTQTVTLGAEDLKVDGGTLKQPGFVRLIATVEDGGRPYRGLGTAAFAPEEIRPVTSEPKDFDEFWQQGKDALAKIPINAQLTPLPEKSTATLDAFQVSLANVAAFGRGTSYIYGILTQPKAPGKYPAMLRVPGAGVYGISGIVKEGYENVITLSIGIHGVPLNLDARFYQSLSSGALNTYSSYNLESRDRYYYRRVYLGCIRAVDYLTSLPNWDGSTLAIIGGSQGGALSIVTAALDPRVKALAVFHPALSDISGYFHGRAGGWPDVFKDPANRTKEKMETEAYYDVTNFARRVKVPGIYSWGYNDETCAPTSTYAAYNVVSAPKMLHLALETGHFIRPDQNERINAWLKEYLSTGKAPMK